MEELRATVPGVKQPEEHGAYHGHRQQAAMMLGQGETDKSRYQGDRPASDSHHNGVERTDPLLVGLKQNPELLCLRSIPSTHARLPRILCCTILTR
jgi:hypothetical protein